MRNLEANSFRQWQGIRSKGTMEVAGECGNRDSAHRTRQSMEEQLLKEHQREAMKSLRRRLFSIRVPVDQARNDGHQDNSQIEHEAPILQVVQIAGHTLLNRSV